MVEPPKRIWIEADDECPYFYEAHELHDVEQDVIEYVRADLYAALEAQLADAREALAESDRQAEKLEALLDPYIAWEGKPASEPRSSENAVQRQLIEFAKWVICEGAFQAADLDGLSIQEKALELGLLTKTSYDPEKHGKDEYAKPGSDWYVFSNLLTNPAPSPAPEAQQDAVACATEGCDNPATNEFIRGDVGSFYCGDCFGKVIEACEARPAPEAQQDAVAFVDLRVLGSLAMGRDAVECTLYAKPNPDTLSDVAIYTRPSEQAVTEAQGWRDMASAPRDGSMVLVASNRVYPAVQPARWRGTDADASSLQYWDAWQHCFQDDDLLGWMPLPTPPAKAQEGK